MRHSRRRRPVPVAHTPAPESLPYFLRPPHSVPPTFSTNPHALLREVTWRQWGLMLGLTVMSGLRWSAGVTLMWGLGLAVDAGLEHGVTAALWGPLGIMVGAIAVILLMQAMDLLETGLWRNASFGPMRRSARTIFPRRTNLSMQSGDVVSALTWDADRLGVFAQFVPHLLGAVIATAVMLVLMFRASVALGIFVAVALPIVLAAITLVAGPLTRATAEVREERGKLTTVATDTAVGLRVLRGIGGEDYYNGRYRAQSERLQAAGFRAARPIALLGTVVSGGPLLFAAIVASAGIWFAYRGAITPGELVGFWALTGYLATPIQIISQTIRTWTNARVSAGRIVKSLATTPLISDAGTAPVPDWSSVTLVDETSGLAVEPGRLTAIVSADPAASGDIARRLARIDEARVRIDDARAEAPARAARYLSEVPLDAVRRGILYSGPVAEVFTGSLRSNMLGAEAPDIPPRSIYQMIDDIVNYEGDTRAAFAEPADAHDHTDDPRLLDALHAADAHDAVESLGGLSGQLSERGRNLSGGQRQRVVLARTLAHNAPVEILVEPTSAVDSHTEARIADNLARFRTGRTTVVVTTSPLVLDRADTVVFVENGRAVAAGRHVDLLNNGAYRAVVARAVGDADQSGVRTIDAETTGPRDTAAPHRSASPAEGVNE